MLKKRRHFKNNILKKQVFSETRFISLNKERFRKDQEFQNSELIYQDKQVLNFHKTMTTQLLLTISIENTTHGIWYFSFTSKFPKS
jgi:hypothetical protein